MWTKLRDRWAACCLERRRRRQSVTYWRLKYRELEREKVDLNDEIQGQDIEREDLEDALQKSRANEERRQNQIEELEAELAQKRVEIDCLELQVRHMAAWSERWQAILESDAKLATQRTEIPRITPTQDDSF